MLVCKSKKINPRQSTAVVHEVWDEPCENCTGLGSDGEAEDLIKAISAGKENAMSWVYPCAWRPERKCKGWCDSLINVGALDVLIKR